MKSEKHSLEVEVLALSDICKKYRQDQKNSMGESEKKLLKILDETGVKRQAYHGNVFIGNHCKVILAKDKNQVYNFKNFAVSCPTDWKENISLNYSGFIVRHVRLWEGKTS